MTITHHYRGSMVGAFALLAAALAAGTGLSAQTLPSMVATAASTGFLAVTSSSTGAIMLDVATDAQGGGASQDFVSYKAGDAVWVGAPNAQNVSTTLASDEPGFYIAAGSVSGVNSVLFRATMADQNGSKAYMGGYVGVGLDVGNGGSIGLDGKIDLFAVVDSTSPTAGASLQFKTAGTGANDGPSTTTVGNYTNAVAQNYTLVTGNSFSYQASAGNSIWNANSKTINNYDVTFAISWVQLTNAITALGNINATNFANFGSVGNSTQLQFFFFTTQNPNAYNQDIGGGNILSNTVGGWANLGALSTTYSGDGSKFVVPEIGTVAQTGLLLLVGGGVKLWRRRRAAAQGPVRA